MRTPPVPASAAGWLIVLGATLTLAGAVTLGLAVLNRRRGRAANGRMLATTSLFAGGVLAGCTGWLILPGTPQQAVEAVRSAALASGAVLAFYAMWLNNERRRIDQERLVTEEGRRQIEADRKEVEHRRLLTEREQFDHERFRARYDGFARAIEVLGNPAAQSRAGGLIMLRSIASGEPELAHNVIDQLCTYLCRPLDIHPDEVAKERHVRLIAQRLLRELLTTAELRRPPDLDLTGAHLHDLDLSGPGVRVGTMRLARAELTGRTSMKGAHIDRLAVIDTRIGGELDLTRVTIGSLVVDRQSEFGDRVQLSDAVLGPEVTVTSAVFRGSVQLVRTTFVGRVVCHGTIHQPVVCTGARLLARTGADGRDPVVLDLSGGDFRNLVSLDVQEIDGTIRLDGARFDGDLRLPALRGVLRAEDVRVRKGVELALPPDWTWHNADDPDYVYLTRRP